MKKGEGSIAFLLYGPYEEKMGYLNKLGISFSESKNILAEITEQYKLGFQKLKKYNQEIEKEIDAFVWKTNWNNFNLSKILKFKIDDITGTASGYIYRIFRLIYKEHIWCSHINDFDSEASVLKKSGVLVQSYRSHLKNFLDSLKKLFFKYYSGSIDSSNVLSANDDAFLESEIKNFKQFNILLIKFSISNLWIDMLLYKKNIYNKVSITLGCHIYDDPRMLSKFSIDNLFKDNEIQGKVAIIDYMNIKDDFIDLWLGEKYYNILDEEFKSSYDFSYSTFHLAIPFLMISMKTDMLFSKPVGYSYNCKVNLTAMSWYRDFGFQDYFINCFKFSNFTEKNLKELGRFINDNTIKYKDLKDINIIENNIFSGAFLETDDPNVITVLPEFFHISYLKNHLMLNFLNNKQKNQMTMRLGKIFEEKYCEFVMNNFKDKENIFNVDLKFINNNPNVNLKEVFNLDIKDDLETDLFFYNKFSNTIYVIELKNIIRKDFTWQDVETIRVIEQKKGWKEKIKKRVIAVSENIEKLKPYFPEITSSTKIRGVIVVSKPIFGGQHYWKDEKDNEYFLCLPLTLPFIQSLKINKDNSVDLNFNKIIKDSTCESIYKKELMKIKK